MWRQTGHKPKELDSEPLPEPMRQVWEDFQELSAARGFNGFGVNPISYTEIDAWSRLTGNKLTPQDIKIIGMLDRTYLAYQAKQQASKK